VKRLNSEFFLSLPHRLFLKKGQHFLFVRKITVNIFFSPPHRSFLKKGQHIFLSERNISRQYGIS